MTVRWSVRVAVRRFACLDSGRARLPRRFGPDPVNSRRQCVEHLERQLAAMRQHEDDVVVGSESAHHQVVLAERSGGVVEAVVGVSACPVEERLAGRRLIGQLPEDREEVPVSEQEPDVMEQSQVE